MSEEQALQDAFDTMARALAEVRQDLRSALDHANPNHKRDFAEVIARLDEIEKKPALAASVGALDAAARDGARKGASEAVDALRAAVAALKGAREIETARRSLSRRLNAALYALVFVLGVVAASAAGVALVRSGTFSLPSTAAGCAAAGGSVSQNANGRAYCAFFVSP